MAGTLFYEVLGKCEYLPQLELSLNEVVEDMFFKEKRRSDRIGPPVELIIDQLKYPKHLIMPPNTYGEVEKFGDRKLFFLCDDRLYDFLKKRDIKTAKEMFSPDKSRVTDKGAKRIRDVELPDEMKKFIDEVMEEGVTRARKAFEKYNVISTRYDVDDIIRKEMEHPVLAPFPVSPPIDIPSDDDINKYYDWTFFPYNVYIIPSASSHGSFSIDTFSPTGKHELLHTMQSVTIRTEEGQDINAMRMFLQQDMTSCADFTGCIGVDLAFFMEGWNRLGRLCRKSVETYQEELGDIPLTKKVV